MHRFAQFLAALVVTAGVVAFVARSPVEGTALEDAAQLVFEMGPTGAVVAWDADIAAVEVQAFGTLADTTDAGALRFRLASLTKPVASAAVLKLVAQGRLSLDDLVTELLPEITFADPRAVEITLRDLLRHSAGFDETRLAPLFAPAEAVSRELGLSASEIEECAPIATAMAARPLGYAPGTQYLYSNTGYCLIEMVLRSRLNGGFEATIRELVPEAGGLDLDETTLDIHGAVSGEQADWLVRRPEVVGAAGGLIGSAEAYLAFLQRSVAEAVAERPPYATETAQYYGLGWRIWPEPSCPARTHFGSMPGVFSVAAVNEDGRRFVALFEGRPGDDAPAFAAVLAGACAVFEGMN